MEKIAEPVSCGCSSEFHEYDVCNESFPNWKPERLFDEISGERVLRYVQKCKQTKNLSIGGWTLRPDNKEERDIKYVMPVHVAVGKEGLLPTYLTMELILNTD
jgi:hypothetical protein